MRLLAFDFDGTLANTEKVIFQTLGQTLQQLGQKIPPASILKAHIGLPLAKIFELACPSCTPLMIEQAVKIYRKRFPENCKTGVELYPGVRATLKSLREAGLILAITSSREKNSLLSLVNQLGIGEYFALIAGEQDVPRHKPEPDIARYALAQTGVDASEAMFIGDTIFDIAAGNGAGMKTCGATYGNHSEAELREAGADYIIRSFPELLDIIKELQKSDPLR